MRGDIIVQEKISLKMTLRTSLLNTNISILN